MPRFHRNNYKYFYATFMTDEKQKCMNEWLAKRYSFLVSMIWSSIQHHQCAKVHLKVHEPYQKLSDNDLQISVHDLQVADAELKSVRIRLQSDKPNL